MKTFRIAVVAILLAVCAIWSATTRAQITPQFTIYPEPVSTFNPAQSGMGWAVEVGRKGFVFVAIYHYTITGQPTWFTMQGEFQPATATERALTGVIGRLNSPLYSAAGGSCINCPYVPPTAFDTGLGPAQLIWKGTKSADFVLGSTTVPLSPLLHIEAQSIAERQLDGVWREALMGTRPSQNSTIPERDVAQVRFVKRTEPIYLLAAPGAEQLLPTSEEIQFNIAPVNGNSRLTLPLYLLNTRTGAVRGIVPCQSVPENCVQVIDVPGVGPRTHFTLRASGSRYQVYPQSPDRMVAYGLSVNGSTAQYFEEFVLTRYTPDVSVPPLNPPDM